MCPRPRTTTDAEILVATGRSMARLGPARLTLADVATEIGLAPATLMQRFGSKRGLLLAFAEHTAATAGVPFEVARVEYPSPLEALKAAMVAMTRGVRSPEELSNQLAFLQMDLSDRDFRRYALAHVHGIRKEIHALLEEAVAAGKLGRCDTGRLARTVQVVFNGTIATWARCPEGTLAARVRMEMEMLLTPAGVPGPPAGGGGLRAGA